MFKQAKAVFPRGMADQMHTLATFRACVRDLMGATLYIAAADFYQVCVNGRFVAFGPARTAKGYARQDILSLASYAEEGENEILIAVLCHHCRSLSTVLQPAFLQAEIRRGEDVLAATGKDFEAFLPACRVRKVERYSVQRHFSEVWDLREGKDWLVGALQAPLEESALPPTVIDRRVPYPHYEDIALPAAASRGRLTYDASLPYHSLFYSFPASERWGRFDYDEIEYHPYEWIQQHHQEKTAGECALPLTLSEGQYAILDFGRIETGFPLLNLRAAEESDVILAFSEDASPDRFAFTDMHSHNVLEFLLSPESRPDLMAFEPYVMRYAILAVKRGSVTLNGFGIKTFVRDTAGVTLPDLGDADLNAIYRGGVRTFAHNAVDLFTDCPSRERAGWLCDSYFTAKTEHALFGEVPVEEAFLENYRLYPANGEYPEGVLPMCYPSEPQDNYKFIPQWTMWYVIEVAEYVKYRNPKADRELFRPTIEGLMAFYARHENEDGLLERLPSWNFVEWSRANDWTMDVSYPTNFLYARVLESAYELFGDESLLEKRDRVQKTAIAQSFDGRVFRDHALRDENGKLVLQKDCSEAGQYYAILFGGFDVHEERFAELYDLVCNVFSANRNGKMPEIAEINAFIGAYLRLEALLKMGEHRLLLRDVKEFFGNMEAETGTLWEYRQRHGSRDHGFASYALVAMTEALKRLGEI